MSEEVQAALWDEARLHIGRDQLLAAIPTIQQSPRVEGLLQMIVRRPRNGQREVIRTGFLSRERGLEGDNWLQRGDPRRPDRRANPDKQVNIMNARAIAAIAGEMHRWPLAGDQLYIDLDMSESNLPAGTRLQIGAAIIEITAEPHLGCRKFSDRFGREAVKFVNSDLGQQMHLRGLNTRVIQSGAFATGDSVIRLKA